MRTDLDLKSRDDNLYVPEPARIVKITNFTNKEKRFDIELVSGKPLMSRPGQFFQVSILGIGEAPISISSPPTNDSKFTLCVRAVGDVTNKMHALKEGDILHIRGPFGRGFDEVMMDKMQGNHLLFIVGGIGYFPARSLINEVIPKRKNYKKVTILYGCKSPAERMYKEELNKIAGIGENVELLETVDNGDASWTGNTGVITTLIPKVDCNPAETVVIAVGPPIMFKFVLKSLADINIPKENIYIDLERRMKCGVGKCGHCQMEGIYVCQEGPVFNYAEVEDNEELL